jgi:hypothetical protein
MDNEAIAVSAIYYYDEENISESCLAFRASVTVPRGAYIQDDKQGCILTWGIDRLAD